MPADPKEKPVYSEVKTGKTTERPVAVLTLQPIWPQIFSGETVTLSCNIQGGEEIEYAFYNSGKSVYIKTEPEYRISPAKNGLYTYKPQAVLSVSPQWLNPGDSVTLSCGVKESSTGWRFFWYRTVPYTAGLLSLSDTSYSVEPLSGNGTSVTPGPSTSVLVGVVVGLVVAGVLLAILLVLLCRYKNAGGSCCNRIFWPPQPQSTNLDPQQDQGSTQGQAPDAGYNNLQHGGANIYDTITPSDSNDNDAGAATAGPSDVMYAQIQLKKLDKKKKKMTADPKETPVYSEVKTGNTTATGPVDVTYAEVDLKQKAKAKKKKETSTPPEADSVYSQLKPVTAPGT
ncbi:uncharacterized protein ACWYII_027604 [Salvelinus alpinus]